MVREVRTQTFERLYQSLETKEENNLVQVKSVKDEEGNFFVQNKDIKDMWKTYL